MAQMIDTRMNAMQGWFNGGLVDNAKANKHLYRGQWRDHRGLGRCYVCGQAQCGGWKSERCMRHPRSKMKHSFYDQQVTLARRQNTYWTNKVKNTQMWNMRTPHDVDWKQFKIEVKVLASKRSALRKALLARRQYENNIHIQA